MKFNLPFDRIIVINYAGDVKRREAMKNNIKFIEAENITHFMYGTPLPQSLNTYANTLFNTERYKLPGNELFCNKSLSVTVFHHNAILSSYMMGCEHILIMEDDVNWINNVELIQTTFDMLMTDKYPIVKLNTQTWLLPNNNCFSLFESGDDGIQEFTNKETVSTGAGSAGYFLNRYGMEQLLKAYDEFIEVPDNILLKVRDIVYIPKYLVLDFSENCGKSNLDYYNWANPNT